MVWDTQASDSKGEQVHLDRIPLDKTVSELIAFAYQAAGICCHHEHHPTCYKSGPVCRMAYPRLLVEKNTVLDKQGKIVLLRRNNGFLVPFILGLLLACPANHSINLACHGDRYSRELQLVKDFLRDNPEALDKVGHTTLIS